MNVPAPPIVILHRYFIAANKMRIRFEKTLTTPEVVNRFPNADPLTRLYMMYVDDYGVFMFYWYAEIGRAHV